MKDFDEIYFAKQRIKWGIDISKLKDGIYEGGIVAPEDITEFREFKEEMGLNINEIDGYLSFYDCKKLTNIGVLPDIVDSLSFVNCPNLTNIGVLPDIVDSLSFKDCPNLTSIDMLPETIKGRLYLKNINQKTKDLLLSKFKLNYWGIDLSLLEDGVYNDYIYAPKDITEFKGFKEELGLEINEVIGRLDFYGCENLTSIGVLPEIVGRLYFYDCTSLTSITTFPKVVSLRILIYNCPFFENMDEDKIREKYGIRK